MNVDIYVKNGYAGRSDYFASLAAEYGVSQEQVEQTAALLGPAEDFDGLVAELRACRGQNDWW